MPVVTDEELPRQRRRGRYPRQCRIAMCPASGGKASPLAPPRRWNGSRLTRGDPTTWLRASRTTQARFDCQRRTRGSLP
jgi:hypothetical protein